MQLKLLVDGGEMKPSPAISQKLGPLGLNLGKIISEVNQATANFKGMKVPIVLDIDSKTKNFSVNVLTPPTAELLKKEFSIEKGSQQPNNIKVANAAIEQVIKVAKIKQKNMFSNTLKSSVKSVLGSCVALGVLVDGKNPKAIIKEVDEGKYDSEINSEKEQASKEKLDKLSADFEKIKKAQEVLVKELEKKAEEKAAGAKPAETKTAEKAAGTKTTETKSAEAKK